MTKLLFLPLSLLIILSACNNERSSRLSARNYCNPENDPAVYDLTEKEVEDEVFVNADLVETDKYFVYRFATTVVIAGSNEEKITLTLSGGTPSPATKTLTVNCAAGFQSNSSTSEPVVFNIPVTNKDGSFSTLKTSVEFGNPKNEGGTDYLRVTSEFIPVVTAEDSEDGDEADNTPVQSFSSYFNHDADDMIVYKLTKPKKNSPETFYVHHRNTSESAGLVSISTRFTVRKAIEETEDKE